MNNSEKYQQVFKSVFNISDVSVLTGGFSQNAVEGWDSLAHLTLVTTLEEEFDVMFDSEDILALTSYEEGIRILGKLGVTF